MSNLYDRKPTTDETSFVDNTADIVGDVSIGAGASVWPGCVIRGAIASHRTFLVIMGVFR